MHSPFIRCTSRFALAVLLCVTLPLQTAQAGLVSTEQVAAQANPQARTQRAHVLALLERADVQQALEQRGVNPNDAKSRVAAMTDDEVAQLSQKLDQVPAGGDVLGVIVFVFLVLLVTDILGFTKVFPFTRPIR
jgi:hypothetical protein